MVGFERLLEKDFPQRRQLCDLVRLMKVSVRWAKTKINENALKFKIWRREDVSTNQQTSFVSMEVCTVPYIHALCIHAGRLNSPRLQHLRRKYCIANY